MTRPRSAQVSLADTPWYQDKGHPHLEEGKTKIRDTHFLKGLKQDKGHPHLEEPGYTDLAPWPVGDPP